MAKKNKLVLGILLFVLLFFVTEFLIKNSDAYETAVLFVKNNSEITSVYGDELRPDLFVEGNIKSSDGVGIASLIIGFSGENCDFKVHIILSQHEEEWIVDEYHVFEDK